jgi:hypothetical protein
MDKVSIAVRFACLTAHLSAIEVLSHIRLTRQTSLPAACSAVQAALQFAHICPMGQLQIIVDCGGSHRTFSIVWAFYCSYERSGF